MDEIIKFALARLGDWALLVLSIAGILYAVVMLRRSKISGDLDLSEGWQKLAAELRADNAEMRKRIDALEMERGEWIALQEEHSRQHANIEELTSRIENMEHEVVKLAQALAKEKQISRSLYTHIQTLYEWIKAHVPEAQPPEMPMIEGI